MPQYFPAELEKGLNRHQEKVMSDRRFYGPALNFLYRRDEEFQTEDLVDTVTSSSFSRLDEYKAGSLLGALRDEYDLIDGYLESGSYYWDPELKAEGDWKDAKQELDRINETGKSKL